MNPRLASGIHALAALAIVLTGCRGGGTDQQLSTPRPDLAATSDERITLADLPIVDYVNQFFTVADDGTTSRWASLF